MKKEGFARSSYKPSSNEHDNAKRDQASTSSATASTSAAAASSTGETEDDDDLTLDMLRAMPKAEKKLLRKRLRVLEKRFKR